MWLGACVHVGMLHVARGMRACGHAACGCALHVARRHASDNPHGAFTRRTGKPTLQLHTDSTLHTAGGTPLTIHGAFRCATTAWRCHLTSTLPASLADSGALYNTLHYDVAATVSADGQRLLCTSPAVVQPGVVRVLPQYAHTLDMRKSANAHMRTHMHTHAHTCTHMPYRLWPYTGRGARVLLIMLGVLGVLHVCILP